MAAKATMVERLKAFRESVWGLLLIVIVLGGIYSGIDIIDAPAGGLQALGHFVWYAG